MEEIFKDIKGYEGIYQISNLGRVKSLIMWDGHTYKSRKKPVFMNPTDNGHGYMVVPLRKNTKRENHYIHRLVAEHFLEKKKGKDVVNHIDFNKSNNTVSNLEWCTQKENIHHSSENMRHPRDICTSKTGEKYIYKRKYGYAVSICRKYIGTYKTISDAVEKRNRALEEFKRNYL